MSGRLISSARYLAAALLAVIDEAEVQAGIAQAKAEHPLGTLELMRPDERAERTDPDQ